jgi:uncharacterized membrane protein
MGDRTLHRALLVLTFVGIGIAGYLTYVHYRGFAPVCAFHGGCEKVQASKYAKVGGVPVPLIGLIGYVSILGTLLVRGELARLATAGLAIFGMLFSGYLTFLELFTIHALCQWCLGSATVMTLIAVLATIRALRAPDALEPDEPAPGPQPFRAAAEREPA